MFFYRRKSGFEVFMHQIAQLLRGHFFRQGSIASDIREQTGTVNHLAAVFDIDDVFRELVHDFVGHVVGERFADVLALPVGLHVIPQNRAEKCQRSWTNKGTTIGYQIPSVVKRYCVPTR